MKNEKGLGERFLIGIAIGATIALTVGILGMALGYVWYHIELILNEK